MTDHQGSRDFLPEESSLFQAPSLEGMFEIIEALADLIEAVQGFFTEIALENPAEMSTELTVYLFNLVRAAIKLRDMFGPLEDMQRPQPVGWPPPIRVQLNILHNRVVELWSGLELNKAPSKALDDYRCGEPGPLAIRVEKRPGAIHDQCGTKYRLNPLWTGCEAVYASILKAALRLLDETSYIVRRAAAAIENAPPAYRPDLATKFLTAPNDFRALLTSCRSCRELARRTAVAIESAPPAHGGANEDLADRPELAAARENAEKLRSALRELGAVDEESSAKEGILRRKTGLTEREYKRAMRFLKKQNAVRTKPRIGTWLVG